MKQIGTLRTSSDTPLVLLYEQGIAYETIRAAYWSHRGDAERMMECTQRAEHYRAAWGAMPENAHRYLPPQTFR